MGWFDDVEAFNRHASGAATQRQPCTVASIREALRLLDGSDAAGANSSDPRCRDARR